MKRYIVSLLAYQMLVLNCNAQTGQPSQTIRLSAGAGAAKVATVDLNRDNSPDIIIANETGNSITVLVSDEKGGRVEAAGSPFPAGNNPSDIATGDFNGDKLIDLAIPNHETQQVTVLLGDGKGGFSPAPRSPFTLQFRPHAHSAAVGDLNGDGKSDLVLNNSEGDTLIVLFGDGASGFQSKELKIPVASHPYRNVTLGDVNMDGYLDIITPAGQRNAITVLLGNGKGEFKDAPGSPFPAGKVPFFAALGDLNGDGKQDVVVANFESDQVTVLLGDGKGKFAAGPAATFSSGNKPLYIAIGDVNGDAIADAVVVNYGSDNLTILLGGKKAITLAPSSLSVGDAPYGAALADLNADGLLDIITANYKSNDISIIYGKRP